jgi:hypothetical protein
MPGRTWRQWDWVDAAALPVLGALTWATWAGLPIAALLDFVTSHQANPSAGPVVLLLLIAGTVIARLARPLTRANRLIVLGGFIAVFAAIWWLLYSPAFALWNPQWLLSLARQTGHLSPGPFLAAIIAAVVWRYGTTVNWRSHDELTRAFYCGVVAMGIGLAMAAAFEPATAGRLTIAGAEFLVSAWAALSLAGVADASRGVAADESPRPNRYWLIAIVTVVGGILALGLLLTDLLTPQTVAGWMEHLAPAGDLVRSVLLAVIYVVAWVVFGVLTPLINWIRSLLSTGNPQPLQPITPFGNQFPNQPESPVALPPAVEFLLRALVVIGLLVVVALVLAWALRRQSATDAAGVRENRELIWSWDLIRGQIAGLLARARPRPPFGELAGDPADPLVWVRQAYRQVLARALARGQARQPAQTPETFLTTLDGLWPAAADALAALTTAYTAARYGEVPPSAGQLAALQAAVDQITNTEPSEPGAGRR